MEKRLLCWSEFRTPLVEIIGARLEPDAIRVCMRLSKVAAATSGTILQMQCLFQNHFFEAKR
jgi:hypothetical protein